MNMLPFAELASGPRDDAALAITRGACRLIRDMGFTPLVEFPLGTVARRVDVIGLNDKGGFVIAEVKSSLADYRADGKWPDYLPFCDAFYFAVAADFPHEVLPADVGIMVADGFGAAIRRPAPERPMNGIRRRHQTTRFARCAARRLHGLIDPA